MTFPSQEDINNAINSAKTEITSEYTTAINNAKTEITTEYTTAINNVEQNLESVSSTLTLSQLKLILQ